MCRATRSALFVGVTVAEQTMPATADAERLAARMAHDAFGRVFRLCAETGDTDAVVCELAERMQRWAQAAAPAVAADAITARMRRLAWLVSGLDQWGLAYAQAFGLVALPPLSDLLGRLRSALDAQEDAMFARCYAALDDETASADFRMALRRDIHMALWHALTACDDTPADEAGAQRIARTLGSQWLALDARLPTLGWRLVADAVAHIQIGCLDPATPAIALERTEALLASLRAGLPAERSRALFALATHVTVTWQRAQRGETVH